MYKKRRGASIEAPLVPYKCFELLVLIVLQLLLSLNLLLSLFLNLCLLLSLRLRLFLLSARL